jgi:hypothetical protein
MATARMQAQHRHFVSKAAVGRRRLRCRFIQVPKVGSGSYALVATETPRREVRSQGRISIFAPGSGELLKPRERLARDQKHLSENGQARNFLP